MNNPLKPNDRLRIKNGKLVSPFGEEIPEDELVMVAVCMDDSLVKRTGLTARTQYTSISNGRIGFMTGAIPITEVDSSIQIIVSDSHQST